MYYYIFIFLMSYIIPSYPDTEKCLEEKTLKL